MFHNRLEAGLLLAEKLKKYKDDPAIVLAVPRGGVPVAYMVARELEKSMEIILTKKIGHPRNKEYAIGAATLNDYFVVPHENVSEEYLENELIQIRHNLKAMHSRYMGNKQPENLTGKTVLLIDDGIATGNTLLATINVLRKSNPAKIVIGAPVASESAVQKLSKEVHELVVLDIPAEFYGVGQFYRDFSQVSDTEVLSYLDDIKEPET